MKRFRNTISPRIKLTDNERSLMRAELLALIEHSPVIEPTREPRPVPGLASFFFQPFPRLVPVTIAFLIFFGTGVAFAAEGTLPGDTLYPVKISVNEGFRRALAVTPTERANLETELAARRITEAESLAVKHRLTSATETALVAGFSAHTLAVRKEAAEMKERGEIVSAALVTAHLETTISAHQSVLAELRGARRHEVDKDREQAEKNETEDGSPLHLIAQELDKTQAAVTIDRTSADFLVSKGDARSTERAAVARGKKASQKIRVARKEKEREREESMGAPVRQPGLRSAEESLQNGETRLKAGAYGEAFASFGAAEGEAEKSDIIAATKEELRLVIGNSIGAFEPTSTTTNASSTGATSSEVKVREKEGKDGIEQRENNPPRAVEISPPDEASPILRAEKEKLHRDSLLSPLKHAR